MLHHRRSETKPNPADIVRFGQFIDEAQIRLLLMLGHAENAIFPWDLNKAAGIIREILQTPWKSPDAPMRGCFGVIGPPGGRLEAVAMLVISSQWYTSIPHIEEYIVYVHPEFRTKRHAAAILDWMIQQSNRAHAPLITGIITQDRMEAKCRLYQRKLKPVGQFFLHMPPGLRWSNEVDMEELLTPSSSMAA